MREIRWSERRGGATVFHGLEVADRLIVAREGASDLISARRASTLRFPALGVRARAWVLLVVEDSRRVRIKAPAPDGTPGPTLSRGFKRMRGVEQVGGQYVFSSSRASVLCFSNSCLRYEKMAPAENPVVARATGDPASLSSCPKAYSLQAR